MDDFGTGYSALSYLKRFPISQLKIDKGFVDGVATEDNDRAIVSAVISLGRALGLETVAEGVETTEQRRALESLGADALQGYLFGQPIPGDVFLAEVRRAAALQKPSNAPNYVI